ncbi:MAG: hypothetical protein A2521_09050 [Deltaproteobacteria bacterium RIFOXYD12_FULL_57_12]|nr:MAG: hypothetical protein A2521_09050 [Deltaproteobacteria bacterium RIFOXYD12_FULL_57_12]
MSMDQTVSRTEVKRRFKGVEHLAQELVELSAKDLTKLPCGPAARAEIAKARGLKAGALKRHIKYIAKMLRQEEDTEALLAFLEQHKGSQLKQAGEFHELERLRNAIIDEAFSYYEEERRRGGTTVDASRQWNSVKAVLADFPDIDAVALQKTAREFARGRNPVYSREMFRMLKAAMERRRFAKVENSEEEK